MTELRNTAILFAKAMKVMGRTHSPAWDGTIFIIHLMLLSLVHTVVSIDKIFSE